MDGDWRWNSGAFRNLLNCSLSAQQVANWQAKRAAPPKIYNSGMSVWALGLNHHTAPLDLRGRFAFALDQIEPTLKGLRASLARQPEATLLSTCNRTEIYCAGEHADLDSTPLWASQSSVLSRSACSPAQ